MSASPLSSFDHVAREYEAGRPDYPEALFDALEPLAGKRVIEGGAGTGIATAALVHRGARVVPFDIGIGVLIRAQARMPDLPLVVADGSAVPFQNGCADLLCFAQSWHWLNEDRRAHEAARVLRAGGRWAAWWSHARADGEPWFEAWWDAVEAVTVARRTERDTDWGADLDRSGLFQASTGITIPWTREVTVHRWLKDDRSKSYISTLPEPTRTSLLTTIEQYIRDAFPGGRMQVPYVTLV
jgi:SAM-dependent methyltransferase